MRSQCFGAPGHGASGGRPVDVGRKELTMKRAIRPAVLLLTLALAAAACSSAPDDPRVASQSE